MLKNFSVQIDDNILKSSDYTDETFQERLDSIRDEATNQATKNQTQDIINIATLQPDLPELVALLVKIQQIKETKK